MCQQAIVVIPVYKPIAGRNEEISLRQCTNVLSKHPICIVTYKGLDTGWYENLLKMSGTGFSIEYFDAAYFRDTSGYSALLTCYEFYRRFSDYNYMLIYQPDAYVFSDELDYWCRQGYDYIGAPWFDG